MAKLLEGIRVVEVTVFQTGPLTTQALANCGAEVIKIDSKTQTGAGTGVGSGGSPTTGSHAGYLQKSTNKLSITLNFSSPKGVELARRLIATADIFVENLAGGSVIRRGLGYEDLKKIKPDLIMMSTCMQGQTGPYYTHGASGHKLSALSGFNQIHGWPDRPPAWITAYTDSIAPHYNVIALLAALDYRRRTGKGQFLDMSQNECGIQFISPLVLDYTANKRVADRMGNKYPNAAPHNAYRCIGDDKWCAISVFTDEEWFNFCKVIGRPGLAKDPRFATLLSRKENEEELDKAINKWTSRHTAEEVMALMQAAGIAAGAAENCEEQEHDPQLKARHFFWKLNLPQGEGTFLSPPGVHFLLSKTPYELKTGPFLGQQNEYVFKKIVGLSDQEYDEMVKEKIIF